MLENMGCTWKQYLVLSPSVKNGCHIQMKYSPTGFAEIVLKTKQIREQATISIDAVSSQ